MAEPASGRTKRWTAIETAFIINYVDHCLAFGKDYKKTVSEALVRHEGRQASYGAIFKGGGQMVGIKIKSFVTVIDRGTSVIDARSLEASLLQAMHEGREALQLGKLQMVSMKGDAASEGIVLSPTGTTSVRSLKRKASMRDSQDPSTSVLEQSIPDVEWSFHDEFADSHYDDQGISRPAKKGNTSSAPHTQLSKQGAVHKLPAATHQPSVQGTQQNSAAANALPSATAPPRKGKHEDIEIIDLLQESPEPPFQRAFVEANHDGTAMSKIFTPNNEPSQVVASAPDGNEAQETSQTLRQTQSRVEVSGMMGETPLATSTATCPLSTDNVTLGKEVEELRQIVSDLVHERMILGFGDTEQVNSRHKWLLRTMAARRGQLLDAISQDLASADLRVAQYTTVMHSLLDGQHPYDVKGRDPKALSKKTLNDMWEDLWLYPKHSFGFSRAFKTVPEPEDAGYVAARLEDLAQNRAIYAFNASRQLIVEIAHRLKSAHLARAILGGLLCQWLFSSPDSMCADAYSKKEQKRYEAELFTRGAEDVQHIERTTMRSLFADENFQRANFKTRADQNLLSLKQALRKLWPDAPGFDNLNSPDDWAQRAVKLKQKLMLDTKEYRIHYCMPGDRFDPSWMKAKDKNGFPLQDETAEGKKVAACLFPALSQHDAPPLPEKPTLDTLNSLMVVNKKFFASFEEKRGFDSQTVVSKAVALAL